MVMGAKDQALRPEQILKWLEQVPDPEIPAINVVEMGIVRGIEISPDPSKSVTIRITPTYSGCPAMKAIEDEIVNVLVSHGVSNPQIETVYAPAWSSDWLTEEAKQKLKQSGIAPPHLAAQGGAGNLVNIGKRQAVQCPYCESLDTSLRSEFGATACKALYYCESCKQPFEYFKEI